MQTMQEFIEKYQITINTAPLKGERPDGLMQPSRSPYTGNTIRFNHWTFKIHRAGTQEVLHGYFSTGPAHSNRQGKPRRPRADEILDSLASEVSCLLDDPEIIYEGTSSYKERKAQIDAIEKIRQGLLTILGEDALNELLYETERL